MQQQHSTKKVKQFMYPNKTTKWNHRGIVQKEHIMPVNPLPDIQFKPYPPNPTEAEVKKMARIFLRSNEQRAADAAAALERRNSDPIKPNFRVNERVNEQRRLYTSYGIDFPRNKPYKGKNGGIEDDGVPFFKFCASMSLEQNASSDGKSGGKGGDTGGKSGNTSHDPNDDVRWGDDRLEDAAIEDRVKSEEIGVITKVKGKEAESLTKGGEAKFKPSYVNLPRLRWKNEYNDKEMITSLGQLAKRTGDPGKIVYVDLQLDVQEVLMVSRRFTRNVQVARALTPYRNLTVLVARGCGITSLKGLEMPNLRVCDLANNRISVIEDVEKFATVSKHIENLNLVNNEVSVNPEFYSRVIGLLLFLRILNEKEVTMELKYRCIKVLGDREVTEHLGKTMWDINMGFVPRIQSMQSSGWTPGVLTTLDVSHHCLTEFHVAPFVNLEVLNLSHNEISTLRRTGLVRLTKLRVLDLSYNKLLKVKKLDPIRWLRSLRSLNVLGNLFNTQDASAADAAHLRLIYITRNLPGSNYSPGLVELNGHAVLPGHKVAALKKYGTFRSGELDALLFRLALCYTVGHRQVRSPGYLRGLVRLNLAGFGLRAVALAGMPALEVLDVSRNRLAELDGLERLTRLRVLDVSGNEKLTGKEIIRCLACCNTLEAFSYGDVKKLEKASDAVLSALLDHNPHLFLINGHPLTVAERVELYSYKRQNSNTGNNAIKNNGNDTFDVEDYRFDLAVCMSLAKGRLRDYTPEAVNPDIILNVGRKTGGKGDKSTAARGEVRKLYLCEAGFSPARAPAVAAAGFTGLRKLSLRGNKLASVAGLGLEGLARLEVLDLSQNRLQDGAAELAQLFSTVLPTLRAVAIRDNPPLEKACGGMPRLHILAKMGVGVLDPGYHLRVLDTPITINDVVSAFSVVLKTPAAECASIRFKNALAFRGAWDGALDAALQPFPNRAQRIPLGRVVYLNLQRCHLAAVQLGALGALRYLVLDHNKIADAAAAFGGEGTRAPGLRTLDVRSNLITNAGAFARYVAEHFPGLRALGIANNPCAGPSQKAAAECRRKVIAAFAERYARTPALNFHNLDDVPVTFEEVARAAGGSLGHEELLNAAVSFNVRPYTEVIPVGAAVDELDLAGCGLQRLPLGKVTMISLKKITRLSLEGNALDDKALLESGLLKLESLTSLDISSNRIVKRETVRTILKKLIRIKWLWVSPNPCMGGSGDRDTRSDAVNFLKKSAAIKNIVIDEGVLF